MKQYACGLVRVLMRGCGCPFILRVGERHIYTVPAPCWTSLLLPVTWMQWSCCSPVVLMSRAPKVQKFTVYTHARKDARTHIINSAGIYTINIYWSLVATMQKYTYTINLYYVFWFLLATILVDSKQAWCWNKIAWQFNCFNHVLPDDRFTL